MTKDEAIRLIATYSNLEAVTIDNYQRDSFLSVLEAEKRKLLMQYYWFFARGKEFFRFPYLHFYDKNFHLRELIADGNNSYNQVIDPFDFFYLLGTKKYTKDEIIEYYRIISTIDFGRINPLNSRNQVIKDIAQKFNQAARSAVKTTQWKEYFDFYIDIFGNKTIKHYPQEILFTLSEEKQISTEDYIELVDKEAYAKAYRDNLLAGYDAQYGFIQSLVINGDEKKKREKEYFDNLRIEDASYKVIGKAECTLDVEIEELPAYFVDVICRTVAKDKLLAMGQIDKARILHAEVRNDRANLISMYDKQKDSDTSIQFYKGNSSTNVTPLF